ncbi:MAG TPA: discoidin domain-containing protein, partial [Thermoanaerobaculia bacterium]|nr:discoidin domain-containing protein [Thermoanaerobaculia bacterium]
MGASIASRTAELDLQHSAVRMIDTTNATGWVTPPSDPVQAIVVSLPARARIDRAGVVSIASTAAARDLRIDFSLDGATFTRGVALSAKQADGEQAVALNPPVEAQYVRFSALNARSRFLLIREAVVNGTLLAPPAPGPLDGCWSIDDQPATFHSDRAAVFGYAGGMYGMNLDGGSDGRFYRFAWTRDKQYGLAAMSVTPDGKHLAAIVWHEEAIDIDQFYADDWLGDRGKCPTTNDAKKDADVFLTYLQRFGYFPLYALRFSDDGTLDDGASSPELARIAKL